jgi:hypothetical protein
LSRILKNISTISTTEKKFHVNNTIFHLPCTPIGAPIQKYFYPNFYKITPIGAPIQKYFYPNFYKITPIGAPNSKIFLPQFL